MLDVLIKLLGGMGGTALGVGVALYSFFQFVQWGFEFNARRFDAREARVTVREDKADKHLGQRVAALERDLAKSQLLVSRYHRAVIILSAEVEVIHPMSPRLQQVRDLLAGVVNPIAPPDPMLDNLMKEAGDALDR